MTNYKVKDVARMLGKGEQCIRVGLARGLFPFGTAISVTGRRTNFIIYPEKLKEYIGIEKINEDNNGN